MTMTTNLASLRQPLATQAPISKRKKKVIIAEDEEDVRDFYISVLEDYPFEITECKDGLEALSVFKSVDGDFDLIISDLRMPSLSGIEFVEQAQKINSDVPIIFISGYAEKNDIVSFLNMGVYDFIEKPVDVSHLIKSVINALNDYQFKKNIGKTIDAYSSVYVLAREFVRSSKSERLRCYPKPFKSRRIYERKVNKTINSQKELLPK